MGFESESSVQISDFDHQELNGALRTIVYPGIRYTFENEYLSVSPKIGYHYTNYDLDSGETEDRGIPIYSLRGSISFERPLLWGNTDLIQTNKEDLIDVIHFLKTNNECKFRQLIDIAGVDYPNEEKRFCLIYLFLSHEKNLRIKVKINFETHDQISSLTKVFPSANWMEREVFDMYGINFKSHPDLRRILTDYNFKGHPLRKDFPLTGFNEVRYSEKDKKVIYEKVKLEQNYRDFDFSSPWDGTKYLKEINKNEKQDDKKN